MSFESELAETATEAETVSEVPQERKARKPRGQKHAAEGDAPAGESKPAKERKPRAPKMVAQLDEEGNPVLDEEGNPIMVPAPKKERATKPAKEPVMVEQFDENGNVIVDEEGNPVLVPLVTPRRPPITANMSVVIRIVDQAKLDSYKGKRGEYTKMVRDGMTLTEYVEAGGDTGYFRRYVREGAVVLEG